MVSVHANCSSPLFLQFPANLHIFLVFIQIFVINTSQRNLALFVPEVSHQKESFQKFLTQSRPLPRGSTTCQNISRNPRPFSAMTGLVVWSLDDVDLSLPPTSQNLQCDHCTHIHRSDDAQTIQCTALVLGLTYRWKGELLCFSQLLKFPFHRTFVTLLSETKWLCFYIYDWLVTSLGFTLPLIACGLPEKP